MASLLMPRGINSIDFFLISPCWRALCRYKFLFFMFAFFVYRYVPFFFSAGVLLCREPSWRWCSWSLISWEIYVLFFSRRCLKKIKHPSRHILRIFREFSRNILPKILSPLTCVPSARPFWVHINLPLAPVFFTGESFAFYF